MPGGICSSYYMRPGGTKRFASTEADDQCYRFEYGGGHWIFGGDSSVLKFIEQFVSLETYHRKSSVFLPEQQRYIPYPLQFHLASLEEGQAQQALTELLNPATSDISTMADWVKNQFGPTLNSLFFTPFHELYTAGLWTKIRPQDNYKTPLDLEQVKAGAAGKANVAGYNAAFVYPKHGLDALAIQMANQNDVRYGHRINSIDVEARQLRLENGDVLDYEALISTLPLNQMMEMTGLSMDGRPDPYSSVLVLNIGGVRGKQCPDDHWIYVPASISGFHRVGFYSNVDAHFLPRSPANEQSRVSLYIERAFLGGAKPSHQEIEQYKQDVVSELISWGIIASAEVVDATWVDVAYTWSWPASTWIDDAIDILRSHQIQMLGRYGRWHFQGISASIKEGIDLVY